MPGSPQDRLRMIYTKLLDIDRELRNKNIASARAILAALIDLLNNQEDPDG